MISTTTLICRTLLFAFTLILSCLISQPSYAILGFGPSCDDAKNPIPPNWVKEQRSYKRNGYRLGFGEIPYDKGISLPEMKTRANAAAQQDLVNSIQVTIKTETFVNTNEVNNGDKSTVSSNTSQRISSASNMELPDLETADTWQDPDSCSVFVMVKLPESVVSTIFTKLQVETYLTLAQNVKQPLSDRIQASHSALEILKNVSFEKFKGLSAKDYQAKFTEILSHLESRKSSDRNAVFFIGESDVTEPTKDQLLKLISTRISGSFFGKAECSNTQTCVQEANASNVPYATIVEISMNLTKDKGFWSGPFDIDISVYSTLKHAQKFKLGKKAVQVMSRQRHQLTPQSAMDKWMGQYQSQFNDLVIE